MSIKEALIIAGITGTGLLVLGFSIGFAAALELSAMVLGAWLMFAGISIIMGHITMEADESLSQARAERQGGNMAHMAYAARDKKDEIEDEKVNGKVVFEY